MKSLLHFLFFSFNILIHLSSSFQVPNIICKRRRSLLISEERREKIKIYSRNKFDIDKNDVDDDARQQQPSKQSKKAERIIKFPSTKLDRIENSDFLFPLKLLAAGIIATTGFPMTATALGGATLNSMNNNNNNNNNSGGIVSIVTQSDLGQSVRRSVVNGAKVADYLDLVWERFSDDIRDEKKCDPNTNRRLYDNGVRSDGTRRNAPVLGALCQPVPLKPITDVSETSVMQSIFRFAEDAAVDTFMTSNNNQDNNRPLLREKVDEVNKLVKTAFTTTANKVSTTKDSADQAQERRESYNRNMYATMRAYGEILVASSNNNNNNNDKEQITSSSNTADDNNNNNIQKKRNSFLRNKARDYDLVWGRKILQSIAPNANRKDFTSPFPQPDKADTVDNLSSYDEDLLKDALGTINVALDTLQQNGLIGHYEISIPEDDYGEVVTIAIDDDVSIGAQVLTRDQNRHPLSASPVIAIIRSAMIDRGKISSFTMDTFFLDPTTTKQELYKPTQLLVSLSNLGTAD